MYSKRATKKHVARRESRAKKGVGKASFLNLGGLDGCFSDGFDITTVTKNQSPLLCFYLFMENNTYLCIYNYRMAYIIMVRAHFPPPPPFPPSHLPPAELPPAH